MRYVCRAGLAPPGTGRFQETTMSRFLAILTCCLFFAPPTYSDEIIFPDGTPAWQYGGLIVIRQGNQRIVSVGGAMLPRHMTVTEATPEGPVVTNFTLPQGSDPSPRPRPVPGPAG